MTVETGPLRGAAALVRDDLRRPAHPGHHHRLLLRRAARGPRRLRHPGGHHRGDAHRARLQADQGRGASRSSPTPRRSPSARSPSRSSRSPSSPSLPKDDLGAMVGRQTPFLALIVPLILVGDGRRQARHPPDLAGRGGRRLDLRPRAVRVLELHLGRAHRHRRRALSAAALVGFLRVWQPGEPLLAERAAAARSPAMAGAAAHDAALEARACAGATARSSDSTRDELEAYAPYVIIIAIFALAQLGPDQDCQLADGLGPTTTFALAGPRRPQRRRARRPTRADLQVSTGPAAGTLLLICRPADHARPARSAPARALRIYGETLDQLKWAIVTVCRRARRSPTS